MKIQIRTHFGAVAELHYPDDITFEMAAREFFRVGWVATDKWCVAMNSVAEIKLIEAEEAQIVPLRPALSIVDGDKK